MALYIKKFVFLLINTVRSQLTLDFTNIELNLIFTSIIYNYSKRIPSSIYFIG